MVKFLEWHLETPLIVASGPLSSNERSIRELFDLGASAVVTKTISDEPDPQKCRSKWFGDHLFNSDGYSNLTIEEWEDTLLNLRDKKIIANIFSDSPTKLAQLAQRLEKVGVSIFELGLSCPTKDADPVCHNEEQLFEFTSCVRQAVPLAKILVKTQWDPSEERTRKNARIIEKAGADGMSCCDTLPAARYSLASGTGKRKLTSGGLSGPALKLLILRYMNIVRSECPSLKLSGIGGISNHEDICDFIDAGASSVQVCTSLMKNGRKWLQSQSEEWKHNPLSQKYNNEQVLP